jgi:hypothetical protein
MIDLGTLGGANEQALLSGRAHERSLPQNQIDERHSRQATRGPSLRTERRYHSSALVALSLVDGIPTAASFRIGAGDSASASQIWEHRTRPP